MTMRRGRNGSTPLQGEDVREKSQGCSHLRVFGTDSLDACAVMAYVRQEPGAEVLKALIERPTTVLAMHVCHLGEVYDDLFREDGLTAAQTAWTHTLALPLELWREADDAFIRRVGLMKVEEHVSFADALALALAERLSIPLVITDHHEFDAVERKGYFRFLWLC
jgi:predicted nucleic acid-binding protein